MAGEPDNFIFPYRRHIDTGLERLSDDVQDSKVRMTNVEEGLAGVNRRLDRIEVRLDRVEHRLDLTDVSQ